MATKWMRSESPSCSSDNDDSYDMEANTMCTMADEPIDLKQVNCEVHQSHDDQTSNDWDTSRLVKTKAFRIKDILGLDDNEKFASAKSMPIGFTTLTKVSNPSASTVPCMYYILFKLIRSMGRRIEFCFCFWK